MSISGFEFSGPPITEAEIRDVEKLLRVKLPRQYREFLLRTNGGRPSPEEAFLFGPDPEKFKGSLIDVFYPVVCDDDGRTLLEAQLAMEGRIPRALLPIGNDAGGSKICLGVRGLRRGKVYFWNIEDERDPHWWGPGYGNIRRIAN